MNYGIIGTGALGGFYGAMLAKANREVHFLLHSDYDHVKSHGLKIDSVLGDFILPAPFIYRTAKEMPKCDVILVCLKTTQNHLLKEILPHVVHEKSVVVLVQNGMGGEQWLAQEFPGLNICGAMAFICSSKLGPGYIKHMDFGRLTIGIHQAKDEAIVHQLCREIEDSKIPCHFTHHLMKSRWEKLVWNIPYNGMSVVMNTTTNRMMQHPHTRQLIFDLMLEVVAGANAAGYPVERSFAEKMMQMTDQMTPYAPSMKLDFDYQREMEVAYIYSNPLRMAEEAGCPMPKTRMLEQQLQFIQTYNCKV